jgi:hypothetical protein
MEKQAKNTHSETSSPEPIITRKAVMVRLSIRAYGGERIDKRVTSEVHNLHHVDETGENGKAGDYKKKLLANAVKRCLRPVNAARQEHYFLTLPVSDTGWRLLPSDMYFEYRKRMEKILADVDEAVRAETEPKQWEENMWIEKRKLNGLFNPYDYPTPEDFRRFYRYSLTFQPIPASNWIAQIEGDELRKLETANRERWEMETQEAMKSVWQRLHGAVSHMAASLKGYGATIDGSTRTKTFRDSVVTNIADLSAILPMLNVTGDPALADMAAKVSQSLATLDPQGLREMPEIREEAVKTADALLSIMDGYV